MKIATFNIQNLFHRHKDLIKMPAGECALQWINEMDGLMRRSRKESRDIDRIKELSFLLGFDNLNKSSYAVMRSRGGELYFKGQPSSIESRANYLTEWKGWTEIKTLPLDPLAIYNKARLVAEVNADVLLLQEVEDKNSLAEMNYDLLPQFNGVPYKDLLVVQGNDNKGRELALVTKNGYQIQQIRSYMGDRYNDENLFEKNLLIYEISTPSKNNIFIIGAHLIEPGVEKEKADILRFKQASRIAELYNQLIFEGKELVVIAGTLNAVSYCHSLSPLLRGQGLKEVTSHESFNVDFDEGKDAGYYSLGAYRKGVNIKQRDYLLLSPELYKRLKVAGLNRKAMYPGVQPKWPIYSTISYKSQAASEHPVIWAEVDV